MLTTKVGPDGRVLVPVELRRELGLEPGATVVARSDGDRLILESRDVILRRIQDRFTSAVPDGVSLVDELLEDRRREAAREGK